MQVGVAAPVLAALVKGTQKESVVSELYGGEGGERAATDEVYSAIGEVRFLAQIACCISPAFGVCRARIQPSSQRQKMALILYVRGQQCMPCWAFRHTGCWSCLHSKMIRHLAAVSGQKTI